MTPLNQQLDLDGGRHDIAPAHETQKLFDSAPQIRGQVALETDYWCEESGVPVSQCVGCQQDADADRAFDARRENGR